MDAHTTQTNNYNLPTHVVHYAIGGFAVLALLIPIILIAKLKTKRRGGAVSSRDLTSEKNKSEIILSAIADGVILIDNNGTIQAFNPGASLITGWPAKEAIGLDHRSVMTFVTSNEKQETIQESPLAHILSDQKLYKDNNALLKNRDGKILTLSIVVSPLKDEKGNLVGAVGIFRDVTTERNEEKQRSEFISTASHEMRTPVAAIEGYLALALNNKVSQIDAKARSYLEKAHASTQSLGKLFQDLLTSAKAEDGRLVSHPGVVEMGAYLEQMVEGLRFAAEKKGLLMDFTIGAEGSENTTAGTKVIKPLYYTLIDPDRMQEVITNIFDNAVKYTPNGKITVGLTGNNDVVQVFVRDTGPGIPAADLPHLFQKFYRVDNSATRTIGGTGLGLFICRKIVELYKGRIWADSEQGKGSTFYINLPRLSAQQAAELQKTESQSTSLLSGTPTALEPSMLVTPQTSNSGRDTITNNIST